MPLQLDIDILRSEDANQPFDSFAACLFAAAHQGSGQRAFIATRQADQPGGVLLKIVECGRAFLLGCLAHLELRDELAEVLIAFAGLAQQRQTCWFGDVLMRQPRRRREARTEARYSNFRADMRANVIPLRAGMEPRGTIDPIAIEQAPSLASPVRRPAR